MKWIDLRSDTVTVPTQEMREAMSLAEVGDDVYGDDPTINELERLAAEMVGKEASIFVPSGTFGNQLAILTHCKRGDEILIGDDCHILCHEAGAAAVIAGVQTRTFAVGSGQVDPEEIRARIRGVDVHYPDTGLICLENALGDGRVLSLENMRNVRRVARDAGVPMHLDGARLFNAAAALGVEAREIVGLFESVMFCLSKGLCAPVGSMLAGSEEFIARARRGRKMMGGGMRQAGILAAAGLISLRTMTARLKDDHDNARYLAGELAKIPGLAVQTDHLDINMVFFDMKGTGRDSQDLRDGLLKHGIKNQRGRGCLVRLVTHYWIGREDIDSAVKAIRAVLATV